MGILTTDEPGIRLKFWFMSGADKAGKGIADEHLPAREKRRSAMPSARNQFKGLIESVEHSEVMTEVVVKSGNIKVGSLISRRSAHDMNLRVGDEVTAIIKATNVIIAKD